MSQKIDLWAYLGGAAAQPHVLAGVKGTNSYETCRSMVDGKGYTRFVKSSAGNYETLWADDRYIYRGLDTSNIQGNEVYSQFENDRYGAVWCDRWLDVNEYSERHPLIRKYTAQGQQIAVPLDGGVSYLHLRAVMPVWTITEFAGRTIELRDVVWLAWTWDRDGRQVIEDYYFSRAEKLVGFDYWDASHPFHTRFLTHAAQAPTLKLLPNFNEPTPPPVRPATQPPPSSGADRVVLPPNGITLRQTPNGVKIRALAKGERVLLLDGAPVNAAGYDWGQVREAGGAVGWCALRGADWGESFGTLATTPNFTLRAPFRRYRITSGFDEARSYPFAPTKLQKHEGLDFIDADAAAYNTDPVVHVGAAGKVVKVGVDDKGYGNYVIVDFGSGWAGWYAHLDEVWVREGQALREFQIIGLMGSTGNSTGPHLHLTLQQVPEGKDGYVVPDVVDFAGMLR